MVILNAQEDSPTRTSFQIEVPAEEVERVVRAVTRTYLRKASIPGFRKGHAPESVVSKKFSGEIRGDVLELLLPQAVSEAVEEKKVALIGRPRIEDLAWDPPGPIRFTARVDRKPNRDQRLERPAQRRQVDLGVEAADHAAVPQRPQPRQRRRRRHPDAVGEALVGDPGVVREQLEQRAVDVVYGGLWMIRHGPDHLASHRRISSMNRQNRRIFGSL